MDKQVNELNLQELKTELVNEGAKLTSLQKMQVAEKSEVTMQTVFNYIHPDKTIKLHNGRAILDAILKVNPPTPTTNAAK
jgi:hypothetical protein